jgi:hypothetical protein
MMNDADAVQLFQRGALNTQSDTAILSPFFAAG